MFKLNIFHKNRKKIQWFFIWK